jgi:hypothetical protein
MLSSRIPYRPAQWLVAAAVLPAGYGLYRWAAQLFLGPRNDDFRDFYTASWLGVHTGWAALYNLQQQRQAAETLGLAGGWLPYFNPPPLAWLIAPLTALPYRTAYAVWTALLAAALFGAWLAVAPRAGRWTAAAHFCVALALYAVTFSLVLGQVVPLLAAAIAIAAWMLARGNPVVAGLVLTVIDLKPQIAFLVPLALLASGAGAAFVAWLLPTLALAGLSALQLGPAGLAAYADALLHNSALDQPSLRLDALVHLPHPLAYAASALAAVLALVTAFRLRALPGAALGVGILGSLLAAPHLNLQDLTLLVVAAWVMWPARLPLTQAPWLAAGCLAVEAGIGTGIPAVLFEVAALGRLALEGVRLR